MATEVRLPEVGNCKNLKSFLALKKVLDLLVSIFSLSVCVNYDRKHRVLETCTVKTSLYDNYSYSLRLSDFV